MPISVVVGGQYGSEGKGKVALSLARSLRATAVVRVGGPNSGHTGVDGRGRSWILRQLPASALAGVPFVILPPGNIIDPDILHQEAEQLGLSPEQLIIDAQASVIESRHREEERSADLVGRIGSTGTGTGAALRERLWRADRHCLARDHPKLKPFVRDFTSELLRKLLDQQKRIVIEGTQGFGLSIWHGGAYPYATSRDTTAAGFVSEAGLAPHDVDDVVLVLRAFPIRVGGNSGPLANEITWDRLAAEAKLPAHYVELTSATRRVRRVARFDAEIVKRAIAANAPHRIVMNHLDYVDPEGTPARLGKTIESFLLSVTKAIGRRIDYVGLSPELLVQVQESSASTRPTYAG